MYWPENQNVVVLCTTCATQVVLVPFRFPWNYLLFRFPWKQLLYPVPYHLHEENGVVEEQSLYVAIEWFDDWDFYFCFVPLRRQKKRHMEYVLTSWLPLITDLTSVIELLMTSWIIHKGINNENSRIQKNCVPRYLPISVHILDASKIVFSSPITRALRLTLW